MTTGRARQIALGLKPPAPRRSRGDFVVTEGNRHLLETLDRWRASTDALLVVTGPEASGKTHLLQILADSAGEVVALLDDADGNDDPRALLLRIEESRETGARLAIAGRDDPNDWAQGLRDLQSRLAAATRIALAGPDDALLRAVILKLFKDRQLRVSPEIADYAVLRLPRTFAAAQTFVAALDDASIAKGAAVGLKLAREVVANLSEEPRPA